MTDPDGVFIFIAAYPNEAAAQADYDIVKELHYEQLIGSFDAAVVTKDDQGKVHVNKDETATRKGAWVGIAAGAVVGILFPPSILAAGALGGVIGGVSGHLYRGLSRSDVKELGEFIDEGEAALLVVGDITVTRALEKADLKATKRITKEAKVDKKDIDDAIAAPATD